MAKLVNARDLKSLGGNPLQVRFLPRALALKKVKVLNATFTILHHPPAFCTNLLLSRTRQLQKPCNLSRDHCVLPSEDSHHVSS